MEKNVNEIKEYLTKRMYETGEEIAKKESDLETFDEKTPNLLKESCRLSIHFLIAQREELNKVYQFIVGDEGNAKKD